VRRPLTVPWRGALQGNARARNSEASTTALAMLGLFPAQNCKVNGSIEFRGEDLLAMEERSLREIRGAHISLVSQELGLALSPVLRVAADNPHVQADSKVIIAPVTAPFSPLASRRRSMTASLS
jgi:hypothetical protein